jgi:hypothetical protein
MITLIILIILIVCLVPTNTNEKTNNQIEEINVVQEQQNETEYTYVPVINDKT